MKIVFILPVASQPRYRRRVEGLRRLGAEVRVLSFERDYFPGNPYGDELESLGHLEHGHYLRRISILTRAIGRVRGAARDAQAIYAFGMDTLALAWLASLSISKPPKLVYEVGDVREVLLERSPLGWLFRAIDRFLVKRSDLLVVTSAAFVRDYFKEELGLRDFSWQTIENKLDPEAFVRKSASSAPRASSTGEEVVTIGYFGLLRCRRSWEILRRVAELGADRYRVLVRGLLHGLPDLAAEAARLPNVEFGGPYHAPEDLEALYASVDIVWACFPYEDNKPKGNWRMARTNRFYEACYFRKPMFAQAGSEDGRAVAELGVGLCLDLSDLQSASDLVLGVDAHRMREWTEEMERIPETVYTLSDENIRLLETLESRDGAR